MYLVSVRNNVTGIREAHLKFRFGQWAEIGFWLDDKGYNDRRYRVTISFIKEGEFRGVKVWEETSG
jgi:hypothetical protein